MKLRTITERPTLYLSGIETSPSSFRYVWQQSIKTVTAYTEELLTEEEAPELYCDKNVRELRKYIRSLYPEMMDYTLYDVEPVATKDFTPKHFRTLYCNYMTLGEFRNNYIYGTSFITTDMWNAFTQYIKKRWPDHNMEEFPKNLMDNLASNIDEKWSWEERKPEELKELLLSEVSKKVRVLHPYLELVVLKPEKPMTRILYMELYKGALNFSKAETFEDYFNLLNTYYNAT